MKELSIIQAKLKAPKGQWNGFGKYNYRSCEDILEALKPLLVAEKCSITISDDIIQVGDRIYIKATCTIHNDKNEEKSVSAFAREPATKKGMDESQITGSTSSYARKYALNGLFAIDDNKDADYLNDGKTPAKTPTQKKPSSALPQPTPAVIIKAIQEQTTLEGLEAKYAKAQTTQFKDDPIILEAYNKAKQGLTK